MSSQENKVNIILNVSCVIAAGGHLHHYDKVFLSAADLLI